MQDKKTYANGQPVYVYDGHRLTYFYKNGRVKAEGPYENELMEGEWLFYRENGQLWQTGHFRGGVKHGAWVRLDREGREEYNEQFADGKQVKKKQA